MLPKSWNNYPGTSINPIDPYNQDIANFNGLTKAGGGSQCYENNNVGNIFPDPGCKQLKPNYNPPIWNPYYAMAASRCSIATAGIRSAWISRIYRQTC